MMSFTEYTLLSESQRVEQVELIEEQFNYSYTEFLDEKGIRGKEFTQRLLDEFYNWSISRYNNETVDTQGLDILDETEVLFREGQLRRTITKGIYLSRISSQFKKLKKLTGDDKLDMIGEILKTMVQYQVFGTK